MNKFLSIYNIIFHRIALKKTQGDFFRYFRILCYAIILLACAGCQSKPDAYDAQGNAIYFSRLQGQWIVINYWASWCKPCWQEIPEINQFYQMYTSQKINVFGVNYDGAKADQLPALIAKMHIAFPTLTQDPKKYFGIAHVSGLPTTIIINPQGKVVATLLGEQTVASLKKAIGLP